MALNKRGFLAQGKTILVSAANPAPADAQAANYQSAALDVGIQARLHNAGPNLAFVAFALTQGAAKAAADAAISGFPASVIALPVGAIEVLTAGQNAWWSASSTGTASVYITPGDGL